MNNILYNAEWQPDCMYSHRTIDSFLYRVYNTWRGQIIGRKSRVDYLQLAISFDMHATSFYHHLQKCACLYAWTLCINGVVLWGRRWDSFRYCLYRIKQFFRCGEDRKIIIYAYNFPYKFQFMRKWFKWSEVFAIRPCTPLSAEIDTWGVVFRCAQLLTGYNMQEMAEHLRYVDVRADELDYHWMRTPDTLLDDWEKQIIINDAVIVCAYISQTIEDLKGVQMIPMTKTGYVRQAMRDAVLMHGSEPNEKKRKREMFAYRNVMKALQLEKEEYELMKDAFRGGDILANSSYIDDIQLNVESYDYCSSYAACIVCDYFPMSRGRKEYTATRKEFEHLTENYCVTARVRFENLRPLFGEEFYIPKSKCKNIEKGVYINRRVVAAKSLEMALTEVDYNLIKKLYEFDSVKVLECWTYQRGRLPSDFVKFTAEKFRDKTELKGIKGRERDYIRAKEDLCAIYGMMVTAIDRDEFPYEDDEWKEERKPDVAAAVSEYNNKFTRFTFYAWGVWVAAHARRRLWNGIINCNQDFLYAHTDSIKIKNASAHKEYFEKYNRCMETSLKSAAFYHDFPLTLLMPKNQEGEVRPLGFWEHDDSYKRFKTTGAGRYMSQKHDGSYEVSVTGLNPECARDYICSHYKRHELQSFKQGLCIPAEFSGRIVHHYIDSGYTAYIKDYKGRLGKCEERSGVFIAPIDYTMSSGAEFFEFLKRVGEINYE